MRHKSFSVEVLKPLLCFSLSIRILLTFLLTIVFVRKFIVYAPKWEYKWRIFRTFRKLLNFMVGQGMKYSSVSVCLINRIVGHELADLIELQKRVEEGTSIKIDYYRKYEI